jgi:N-acetylglucosaminyldiphosphoundecaprenol N-acetyl-beta-D-mannosaminyltransferase
MEKGPHIRILGYNVFSGDKNYFRNNKIGIISTLNPHCYILARKDRQYHQALLSSDLIIPDGIGIKYAARFLSGEIIRRISGSELHEEVISSLNKSGGSCFYLGSSEATLEKINIRLSKDQPAIRAGFLSPPFKNDFSNEDNLAMIEAVRKFNPDVLFVGMTAPKQEKWVYQNREKLNIPLICSIGAVFDFYSGTVRRPGNFWIKAGLEWLPRLLREPGRLWRRNFVSTPMFVWYVAVEKLRLIYSGPRGKGSSKQKGEY